MSTRGESYNQTFQTLVLLKYQLDKSILIFFPDPDSPVAAGAGVAWSWEVFNVTTTTVVASAAQVTATENYIEITLATGTYVVGNLYRVRLFNNALGQVDEWFFSVYSSNFGGIPPVNIASINDKITRIAGLLGLNQVVRNTVHDKGVPAVSEIDLYDGDPQDPASVIFATYKQVKFLDPQFRVDSEISTKLT